MEKEIYRQLVYDLPEEQGDLSADIESGGILQYLKAGYTIEIWHRRYPWQRSS